METFGKYQLLKRLGSGGMAEVFLAREPLAAGLAKLLVIKKIQPALAEEPEFRAMFEDEAKIAVNLNHPNVVQTFGYGQLGGIYYLVMEYVEGLDLLSLIAAARTMGRRFPPGLSAYVIQQVSKGLDYAHRKTDEFGEPLGIVHRDVSPQNILVSHDGAVKVFDFGIARARGAKDDAGVVKGKLAYMSPEQAGGLPVDRRSDVFSAGIVLYELLTGRSPFAGLRGRRAVEAVLAADFPRPRDVAPEVPAELEAVVLQAMALAPEDRYQAARELHYALGRFFFDLGSREGTIYDSGALAAFVAEVLPTTSRLQPSSGRMSTQPLSRIDADVAGARRLFDSPSLDESVMPPEPPRRERRNVVVVTGALGGLEELRRTHGDARAREALLDFLRVAEHIAYKHRAHTDRVDERGFVYLIGLPMGGEDDATRAVELARALGEALDGITRDLIYPWRLGIGILRGTALVTLRPLQGARPEYELQEGLVDIAERLAREASPGDVLVSGSIYRAARGEWRFEELPYSYSTTSPASPTVDLLVPPSGPARERDEATESASESPSGDSPAGEPLTAIRTRIYRVRGQRPRGERTAARPIDLVGRDLELKTLSEAYQDATQNNAARCVLLIGDRGVGKRALVRAFTARLDPEQHLVLRAVARPMRREIPYALTSDLVRDFFGADEDADPRDLGQRIHAAVRLFFGSGEEHAALRLGEALALLLGIKTLSLDQDPEERRLLLYRSLRLVADRLARQRTLVLALEDLHLADAQSLDLFESMVRYPWVRPLILIATARRDRRIDRLVAQSGVVTLLIDDLGPRYREALVRSRLEVPEDAAERARVDRLVAEVIDRAGGNPFYILETIESLVEREALVPGPSGRLQLAASDTEIAVPATVEEVIAARIDRLPDAARNALRVASVIGRSFRPVDLAALLGTSDVTAELRTLVQRDLIDTLGSGVVGAPAAGPSATVVHSAGRTLTEPVRAEVYAFRNTIIQEVAYRALPPEICARLHRQVAERILSSPAYQVGADDARLGRHLELAGERGQAARAYARAGLHARDAAGNAEAFGNFTRALKLLGDETPEDLELRWDLHAEREQILRALGKRTARLREIAQMRQIAERAPDRTTGTSERSDGGRRLGQTLVRLARLHLDTGKHAAARRELSRALAVARDADDPLTEAAAHRLEAILLAKIGYYGQALDRTREGLAALNIERPAAPRQSARSIDTLSSPLGSPASMEQAFLLERAQLLHVVGDIELDQGRRRDAERAYGEALALYRRLGMRRLESALLTGLGNVAMGLGEYEEAIRHYKLSLKFDQEVGDRFRTGATLSSIGQTYALLGDFDRARRYLDKALELAEASGDMEALTEATLALGRVLLRLGQVAAAAERLERGLELAQGRRNRLQEIHALIDLAHLRLASGHPPDTSLELARSAVRLAREAELPSGVVFGLAAEAETHARMDEMDTALACAREAVAQAERAGGIELIEEVLHLHARMALARGDVEEARSSLRRALAEVEAKVRRLSDESWRTKYLAASPAREILADARTQGLV